MNANELLPLVLLVVVTWVTLAFAAVTIVRRLYQRWVQRLMQLHVGNWSARQRDRFAQGALVRRQRDQRGSAAPGADHCMAFDSAELAQLADARALSGPGRVKELGSNQRTGVCARNGRPARGWPS